MKQNDRTKGIRYQERYVNNNQYMETGGTRGKIGNRMKFPQQSADLSTRWCSAYLKIDVASMAIRNQSRFNHSRTLVVTGERRDESGARAKYNWIEPDRADNRNGRTGRHVDHVRPIHGWTENQVWQIIERWGINAHPAYHLGWGRLSCMTCIFGSPNQWASAMYIAPDMVARITELEHAFGEFHDHGGPLTIKKGMTATEQAERGQVYEATGSLIDVVQSQSEYYNPADITVSDWQLPAGAFGENAGPS